LQVSTFPFLAVLLCAMGSLILLLLVIDRRAKAVARAKALQAVARLTAEEKQAEARRQAELERRRQDLHDQLQRQDEELVTQAHTVADQATATARTLEHEQTRAGDLQRQLYEVSVYLSQGQEDVKSRQAELAQTTAKTEKSRKELAEMTADLVRLERTLADLKTLREREKNKYSLVPYRGRRGDNRRPIYLECGEGGLIFHPDHLVLPSLGMSAPGIRAEVESRIARQRAATATVTAREETPYLLMLVRPNGIETYYRTMRALDGLKIDFGYEFIEADWVLDFPEKAEVATQPWMTPPKTSPSPPVDKAASPNAPAGIHMETADRGVAFGAVGPETDPTGPANGGGGSSIETPSPSGGSSTGAPSHLSGLPSVGGMGNPSGPSDALEIRPTNRNGMTSGRGFAGAAAGTAHGLGDPTSIGFSRSGGGTGPLSIGLPTSSSSPGLSLAPGGVAGATAGTGSGSGIPTPLGSSPSANLGPPTGQPGSGQIAGNPAGIPNPTGLSTPATPGGTTPAAPGPSQISGQPNQLSGSSASGKAPPGPWSPASPALPSSQSTGDNKGDGQNGPAIGVPALLPGLEKGGQPSGNSQGLTPSGQPSGNSQGLTPSGQPSGNSQGLTPPGQPNPNSSGEAESSGNPGIRPFLQSVPRYPETPSPPSRPRLFGNRDWMIPIECTADTVVVLVGGQRIALTALAQGTKADNLLLRTVRQLIERRQAIVRPGEPRYRPIIRFLVRPDGLRAYYLAYPALESLQVPMTRENLRNDEKRK
jgi:hypothetical protein